MLVAVASSLNTKRKTVDEVVSLVKSIPELPVAGVAYSRAVPPEFTCNTCPADPKAPPISILFERFTFPTVNKLVEGINVGKEVLKSLLLDAVATPLKTNSKLEEPVLSSVRFIPTVSVSVSSSHANPSPFLLITCPTLPSLPDNLILPVALFRSKVSTFIVSNPLIVLAL